MSHNNKLPSMRSHNKTTDENQHIERISMSIPGNLLAELDQMIEQRGLPNRSHAVAELIHREVSEWKEKLGTQIMTGTITLFYNATKRNLQSELAKIQRIHIAEVISSLHVQLEDNHTMEVLVIQGPAIQLRKIADSLIACKGVKSGNLNLTTTLIPQVYNRK
jgi:CopG family nickel-responsive transcriptional regulator